MIILCESIQINFIQIYFKKVMTQRHEDMFKIFRNAAEKVTCHEQ